MGVRVGMLDGMQAEEEERDVVVMVKDAERSA